MMRHLLLLLLLCPALTFADWQLNNDLSRLSFVTVKAGVAAEVHRFQSLSGNVDAGGNASVDIHLTSVDTGIEIRNERMRKWLFRTDKFSTAELRTMVDIDSLEGLPVGSLYASEQDISVSLHGAQQNVRAQILITRASADRFLVTSTQPVLTYASQFALIDGIEKLRQLAGLPSISPAVPVSFQLVFDRR